jgi:obscurin-RhoGEF protein
VEEEGSVTLQCETAQPASNATWSKEGVELKAGGRYEMSQKETVLTLTIKQLEEKDSGTYTCDVGTATMMAKVTVKGKTLVSVQYRSFLYRAYNYYEITKQFIVN